MPNYSTEIAGLIHKYISGTISPGELDRLAEWRNVDPANEKIFSKLTDDQALAAEMRKLYSYDESRGWDKLQTKLVGKRPVRSGVIYFWIKRISIAAILAGVVFGTLLIIYKNKLPADVVITPKKMPVKYNGDKPPGQNGALLILDNGQQIVLDSSFNGDLAIQGTTRLQKKNGQLIYDATNIAAGELIYNKIITSRGRQYTITLSDGSKVWLNSASSIRYPVVFNGNERKVEITGEAYFEVAKNASKPFRVIVDKMEIAVLGTHFNVNAYTDEDAVKTTLLEGKVKLSQDNNTALLLPGQQASYLKKRQEAFKVESNIDVEKVMAWKKGVFEFDDCELSVIMRQVSRWYDVEIVYEQEPGTEKYGGAISKKVPLSSVLDMLEVNGIKFSLQGNKLIVKP